MQLQTSRSAVTLWLVLCLALVAVLMVVTGTARLKESGYSITGWKPVENIVFPADDAAMDKEFEAYKALPQFQKAFPAMELDEFRAIYTLEYYHYILNYVLAVAVVLPFSLFALARSVTVMELGKLVLIFGFGGLQWLADRYMAAHLSSDALGLTPYQSSLQLGMQYVLLGLMLWQVLTFSYPEQGAGGVELPKPSLLLKCFSCAVLALIFLPVLFGGALSGLHGGLSYNTFPLMDGAWLPDGLWPVPEWYRNLFEDAATAQFIHRVMAYLLCAVIPLFWLWGHNNPHIAHLLPILFSIFIVQFLLGVLTLLFAVPIPLASLHQANSILFFSIAVTIVHRLFIPIKTISYDIPVSLEDAV